MALLLLLAAVAAADPTLLDRVRHHAAEDLAAMPNYVCIDSIERTWRPPGETAFPASTGSASKWRTSPAPTTLPGSAIRASG